MLGLGPFNGFAWCETTIVLLSGVQVSFSGYRAAEMLLILALSSIIYMFSLLPGTRMQKWLT
jgi:hypothetical protein